MKDTGGRLPQSKTDQSRLSSRAMMSSTRIGGRFALRLCILNHRTTGADVDAVLDRVVALAGEERG